jgi:hypothetical protein
MPLFDAYVMVDWSAAKKPATGKDSIWIATARCSAGGRVRADPPVNLPTRAEAEAYLGDLLRRAHRSGTRMLVGFDFPFGYPRGTADWLDDRLAKDFSCAPDGAPTPHPTSPLQGGRSKKAAPPQGERRSGNSGLCGPSPLRGEGQGGGARSDRIASARSAEQEPPWRRLWAFLEAGIADSPDNTNNRFTWAAAINRSAGGADDCGDGPFWGYPFNARTPNPGLPMRRPAGFGTTLPPERRLADSLAKGAETVWHLANGAGVVGSQALLGIPILARLRWHPALAETVRVWPFETGLRLPAAPEIVLAEIWPSLFAIRPRQGEIKDAAQVRGVARALAERDALAALAALFEGPSGLTDLDRRAVETEEAWILGLDGPRARASLPLEAAA